MIRFAFSLAAAACAVFVQAQSIAQEEDLQPGDPATVWTGLGGLDTDAEGERWAENALLENGVLYEAPMVLHRTGRLTDSVDLERLPGFRGRTEPGTPVYARLLADPRRRRLVLAWCVPAGGRMDGFLDAPGACLFRNGDDRVNAYRMNATEAALDFQQRGSQRYGRDLPGIAEQPVDFGPLWTEVLRYEGEEDGRAVITLLRRGEGEAERLIRRLNTPRDKDGFAYLRHSGGAWRLGPAADGEVTVELISAPISRIAYAETLRDYVEFMRNRTGGLDWARTRPAQASLADMANDGFIPGETDPSAGLNLRSEPLPAPLGGETPASDRIAYSPLQGHLLLELADAPIEAASGVLERGDVIAIHAVRARYAITIDEPLEGINRDFEPGAVFGLLALGSEHNLAEPPARQDLIAWCDLSAIGVFTTGNLDCFQDRDGDGRLDLAVMGDPRDTSVSLTLGGLRERREIEPHPYREADPENHPVGALGYRYCEGDNITAPARFAPVYRGVGGERWVGASTAPCTLGVWPDDADRSLVEAGALRLRLTPGEDALAFAVEARLPAEPVYIERAGTPPAPIATLGSRQEEEQAAREELAVNPLLAVGAPDILTGRHEERAAFARIDVRHGVTGRLRNAARQTTGWFKDDPLPVGSPVFGVPMDGLGGLGRGQMIWCAPRREDGEWDAVCFPTVGANTYWYEARNAFYNTSLRFSTDTPNASPPDVEPGPVEFEFDLRLEVFLVEWDRNDADLRVRICGGAQCHVVRGLAPSRAADGSVELEAFGAVLRLTRPEDGDRRAVEVEIVRPAPEGYTVEGAPNLLGEALGPVRR